MILRIFAMLMGAALLWSPASWALHQCKDEKGVVSFRDTPCPTSPTASLEQNRLKFQISAEAAKLATQVRLGMAVDDIAKLLGKPVDSATNGERAWYRFQTPIVNGKGLYSLDVYTLKDRTTSITDEYRRMWARGKVWRGIDYESVLWTWGEPTEKTEENTTDGLKRTLVYESKSKKGNLDTVIMVDNKVTEIIYKTR